jgi:hypothetical protein
MDPNVHLVIAAIVVIFLMIATFLAFYLVTMRT